MQQIEKRDDGWWNLTAIARHYNKTVADFLRLRSSRDFVDRLEKDFGRAPLEVTMGGGGRQGTWGHPTLGLWFWAWADPEVAFRVYRRTDPQDLIDD